MNETELREAINGLYAYDTGSVDSGIRDEVLRAEVIAQLRSMSDRDRRILLGRIVRGLCLSDEALEKGYGPEDAQALCTWLDDQGVLV